MIVGIARHENGTALLLATGFIVDKNKVVTAAHVINGNDKNLCIVYRTCNVNKDYQDATDNLAQIIDATVNKIDPTTDVLILTISRPVECSHVSLSSSDATPPLSPITILGYPHCPDGRLILTAQSSAVGARALLNTGGLKRKHLVLNTLTRPGQSGSPVFKGAEFKEIVAMILGTYKAPGPILMIQNIDPSALNQTTHAISAEYIKELIEC